MKTNLSDEPNNTTVEPDAALRKRLQALATAKNKPILEAVNEQAYQYRQSLDMVVDLSEHGPLAIGLNQLFAELQLTGWPLKPRLSISPYTREALIQYLQLRKPIPYDAWRVVKEPDPARSDEENLELTTQLRVAVAEVECEPRDRDIEDLLWMMGKLAHNVRSAFLSRIMQFLLDVDKIDKSNAWVPPERATQLVDEFAACWTLLMKEVQFLDTDEVEAFRPKRPTHDDDERYALMFNMDTDGMDAESATRKSRYLAFENYYRYLRDLGLMPPEANDKDRKKKDAKAKQEAKHPMETFLDTVTTLVDEVEKGKPTDNHIANPLDYVQLERILGIDMAFQYIGYEEHYEKDEDPKNYPYPRLTAVGCSEPTREDDYRKAIVKQLGRYLDVACKLAKEKDSKALDDLNTCRSLMLHYQGDFTCPFDYIAAKDLKLFMTCFKRARHQLWLDCDNYTPPKQLEVFVNGYTPKGRRETEKIVHSKPKERGYFSDKNLMQLFKVKSENTIYNWRHLVVTPPEGFLAALDAQNYDAMDDCAERYKANRQLRKADAMNTKHLVHGATDERQYQMGARQLGADE